MRALLLAGALAVGFAIAAPISVAPASAQVAVDTPIGGVRVATSTQNKALGSRDYFLKKPYGIG
jgi:hypothetical protein